MYPWAGYSSNRHIDVGSKSLPVLRDWTCPLCDKGWGQFYVKTVRPVFEALYTSVFSSSPLHSCPSGGEIVASFSLQMTRMGKNSSFSHFMALIAPKALLSCRTTKGQEIIKEMLCHSDFSCITFPQSWENISATSHL